MRSPRQELASLAGTRTSSSRSFSPDGRSWRRELRIRHVRDLPAEPANPIGEPKRFRPARLPHLTIDFSPDGKLMERRWRAVEVGRGEGLGRASGNLIRSLDSLHSDTVFGLRSARMGPKLASASAEQVLR